MNAGGISIEDLPLKFEVTESSVEQFARSHAPTDILRELVQNEYDAEGSDLVVHLGSERLVITGNGTPIDPAGWQRLRVMLGTGWVPNSETYIEPKKSQLGSKNFGLRSLFTVGDAIWVYSWGKWSVLHWRRGALYPPREAQESPSRGVRIEVPYRRSKTGALEPFTSNRRSAWVQEIGASLAETLIKLAHTGRSRSLRRVVLRTDDGPEVSWEQRAREVRTPARGIRLVRRQAVQESAGNRKSFIELEYQARVQIPASHRQKDFPAYFRSGRNMLWIGVSIRLDRGQPDANSAGLVYYPLGAPLARTGNLVSLNAPFELDNNRANIVSPSSSSWNEWLIQESVDLTVRLLTADWYERFGAGAYLALEARERESGNQLAEAYAGAVVDYLRSGRVWATRGRDRGKVTFVAADALVLPVRPELDGFFEPDDYLDAKLGSNDRIARFSSDCGAECFGPDSLVRLRCAGEDASSLRTRPQDQGNWYFPDFDRRIRQLPTQVKFAQALDKVRLTASHRADLLDSATTLAADGSLHALSEPLQVVPSDAWEACPVPLSQRLHPDLAGVGALSRLARKFDMTNWIQSTARRAREHRASDEERRALMNVVLARRGRFDARTLSLLRGSPVLLDHRGHWVEPRRVTSRGATGARALAPVLSFPATSYTKDSELGHRLSFRTEADGGDLVSLAEWVSTHPDKATQLEAALLRLRHLVRPAQWRRLREIECLRSSNGSLTAPQNLYVRTHAVLEVLGDRVSYVDGLNRALHERMGCNVLPRSSDIAAVIEQNRDSDRSTAEALYVALVAALRRERRSVTAYADEAIVWTQRGYASPSETLVRSRDPELFLDAVAVARPRSEKAVEALRALGCRTRPVPADWVQVITSISQSVGTEGIVSNSDRSRLLRAYAEIPNGIPDGVVLTGQLFVLGRDGRLHDPNHVLVDDYPQLAELLGAIVSIAEDSSQAALPFYGSCGVRRLGEAALLSRSQVGNPRTEPNRLGATKARKQLNSSSFRSGLSALISRETADRPGLAVAPLLATRLPRVQPLVFVDAISHEYQLDGVSVTVQARHLWDGTTLSVVWTQSRTAFRDTVSYALAEAVTGSPGSARILASAIYRLLECNSTEEIAEFLALRGIPWQRNVPFEVWEVESEPDGSGERPPPDGELIAEQIGDALTTNLVSRASRTETNSPPSPNRTNTPEPKPEGRTLPPIEEVVTQEITPAGTHISAAVGGTGGSGSGGGWSPRDPEWDRLLGERGEEIVYRRELERLRESGHGSPESLVSWVARDNPTADHDIRSIAEDGDTLWIEVKSTSGLDGNFDWPESEVAKAMAEREHYVLCRVYRVSSTNPLVKRFPDPLSMIVSGHMRLGLGSVRAQVEPSGTGQESET